jgi:hypothetical protein
MSIDFLERCWGSLLLGVAAGIALGALGGPQNASILVGSLVTAGVMTMASRSR